MLNRSMDRGDGLPGGETDRPVRVLVVDDNDDFRRQAVRGSRGIQLRPVGLLICLGAAVLATGSSADDLHWKSNGPEGGFISNISASPFSSQGPVYVAGPGGFFRRWSRESDWSPINPGLAPPGGDPSLLGAYAVAASPDRPSSVIGALYFGGLHRSEDSGETWTSTGPDVLLVRVLLFDPRNPSIAYAGGGGSTFATSLDGGTNWNERTPSLFEFYPRTTFSLAVDPIDGAIYAGGSGCPTGGSGCVSRSADGGQTWTVLAPTVIAGAVKDVLIDPLDRRSLFVLVSGKGIYKSPDQGQTWSLLAGPSPATSSMFFDPVHPEFLWAGTNDGRIFRTADRGSSWILLWADPFSSSIEALRAIPGGGLLAGTNAGILESLDEGKTWLPANRGLRSNLEAIELRIDPGDPRHLFSATASGVFQSRDGGSSWVRASLGLPNERVYSLEIDPLDSRRVFAGLSLGVFRSTDGGLSWAGSTRPGDPRLVYRLYIDPADPQAVLAGTSDGLLRSDDSGVTWKKTGFTKSVFDLVADPANHDVLYLGSSSGVYRSADRGTSWTLASSGTGTDAIFRIAVDPQSPERMFAATLDVVGSGHLYRSDNGANSWRPVFGLPAGHLVGVVIDPARPSRVYVAIKNVGVFESVNDGGTWHALGEDLEAGFLNSLSISPDGSVLYASTNGVFSLERVSLRPPARPGAGNRAARSLPPRR